MPIRTYKGTDFSGQLAVVSDVRERLFDASLAELRAQDEMIVAFRLALKLGIPVDELSAETGISADAIRKLAARNLTFGEDLPSLSGDTR